ncbi:hypothetical protein WH47_08752 [Habropoda laboriosa]|uniref:Uncharacterized protein n=1 Tax=Habropoda laboriosa TaxID=597456 RepID=A0A0L7R668_9HYME|nr:hypothetical protein WH47_08752 [Habropoda laboriosa]
MLFGVGVLDGQGSPAPNGLPRSVKLSVVVLPGRSTLVATSMPPPQPTVLADKLADDVVAAAVARTPYGARILGPLFHVHCSLVTSHGSRLDIFINERRH